MPLGNDFTTVSIRRDTLNKLQHASAESGLKIYAIVDRSLDLMMSAGVIKHG